MPTTKKPSIDINTLLTAEFEYIAQTTSEAHDDRARVSSFYLIAVGSLVAALFGAQFFNSGELTPFSTVLLGILFSLLACLGASTVWQLGRLRVAWYESMLAMNKIKDFAIEHNPELEEAFLWRTKTLPKPSKKKSIAYYQVIEVSVISGLMLGAAVFFLLTLHPILDIIHLAIALTASIIMISIDLNVYDRSLK